MPAFLEVLAVKHDGGKFGVVKEPDALIKLIGVGTALGGRRVNCAKMGSRPTRASGGEYVFLVDFEGHQDDPTCAEALAIVRSRSRKVSVFGSYPRAG